MREIYYTVFVHSTNKVYVMKEEVSVYLTFDSKVQRKLAKLKCEDGSLIKWTPDRVGAIFVGETDVLLGEIFHSQL